jgi:hypothetical protein
MTALVVATDLRRAQQVARTLNLPLNGWRYVMRPEHLRGTGTDATIYIEDTWTETPRWQTTPPEHDTGQWIYPITEEIAFLRNVVGVNVVYARSR